MSQVVQLYSNPASGSYNPRRMRALTAAFEAQGATVLHTPCGAEPPPVREETTHVCVAGGDGTVRQVAGAIARSGRVVTLSIYPAGTVNLLAMEAGYPRRPDEFARQVLSSEPRRPHYPVTLGDGYFFACAGVGPDSLAVGRVSPAMKRRFGRVAYALAVIGQLFAWPRHSIMLTCGDRELACEAFYVAKGRYYAGRWSFARDARVGEPVLHVVALRTARRRDYARFVWALVSGADAAALGNVDVLTCTSLSVACGEPLPIQADGDIVGVLPATMTVSEAPLVFC